MLLILLLDGGLTVISSWSNVSAAIISDRSLQISTAQVSASADYTFTFTPASTSQIQSMQFVACTTAIGTCNTPSGINIAGGTVTQSGFQGTASFAKDTTSTGCTSVATLCIKRTDATAQTITSHQIVDSGAVNPDGTSCATVNCTFFIRITTYSDAAYATTVDTGNVASSTTQELTISATVAEELSFCIGATVVDDATSTIPSCSTISGTSLNLGVLDPGVVAVSPVLSTNYGDQKNGIAEVSSNAANGVNVAYDAVQQAGTNHKGALRVPGATCQTTPTTTDQCINSIGVTKAALTAGTEDFGMTVAGINCSLVSAYTCNFSGGQTNLTRAANYNCDGTNTYPTTDNNQVNGNTHCSFAWDETGTAETIASSTTAVGNEALILKFAATPNLITPTGSYTAQADFVATPTY